MHRDNRFFDNPNQFIPERWADGLEQRLPKGVYFPFGNGPRVCIGKGFAMMETTLVLVAMAQPLHRRISQKFRLTLPSNHPIEPQPSITLRPKGSVNMRL